MILSASRVLRKSINLNKEVLTNARLLSVGLSQVVRSSEESQNKFRINRLKDEIDLLEINTRKFGKIDPFILQECLKSLDKSEKLSSRESLLLLKCCGQLLFNCSKIKRNEYLNQLWNAFKKKRMPLDVMHYNLLIKTYVENEYKFDPEEVINEMKILGIKPNKRTYEFVINKYCLDSDLDKVTKILEQMNEDNFSLTAPMFDSLILGHFMNKDIDQAIGTFELMKESNIEITNSTYKNLVIGYLKNYDSNKEIIDKIKNLINEKSIQFEIIEVTEIIEFMNKNQIKDQALDDLKWFLIENVKQSENYFNDLANCFYLILVNGEYKLASKLFDLNFKTSDETVKDRFVRHLLNTFIRSDLAEFKDSLQFLKELHPKFDFLKFARNVLNHHPNLSIDEAINIFSKFLIEEKESGAILMLLDRCKTMDETHKLIEFYLKKLNEKTWINHIKLYCLPKIKMEPIQFLEEHCKRNQNKKKIELLTTSVFCFYLDSLNLDKLKELKKRFDVRVELMPNFYAIERTSDLIQKKPDQFKELLELLKEKIAFHAKFNEEFVKFCIENLKDEKLRELVDFYDKYQLSLPFRNLDGKELNKLKRLERSKYMSAIDEFKSKLVIGEEIEIDEQLIEFRNSLSMNQLLTVFSACIAFKNYKLTNFFYSPHIKFMKPTLLRFIELKLANGEDKKEAIKFLDEHFNDTPSEQFFSLNPLIDKIFDYLKDDIRLVYAFIDKTSILLHPSDLYFRLVYFYNEAKDNKIGENLIVLNNYLLNKLNVNRVFSTMVTFIETRNTTLLQNLCDKLVKNDLYGKSKVYEELAIAFVYTERFKQAIKVIQTDEFTIEDNLDYIFHNLIDKDKREVIKQFSILVYQNSPKLRKILLNFLNDFLTKNREDQLFQQILIDIKNLSSAKQSINEKSGTEVLIREQEKQIADSIEENIELIQKTGIENKELIALVDQIIAKKKVLKLNVECDLINKLISNAELDKTSDLVYDMLKNERYPIPATIKNVLKEFNSNCRLDLIEKLEPYLPLPLKESEFYKSNKILTYLRTTSSETDIVNCLKQINLFSSDLIDQILTIKPDFEQQIINLLKEKKKSNLNYVWLHYMKKSKFDKALNLVINHNQDINVQNLLYQPILNLLKQNNDFELAKSLVEYATKFELKQNTVQSIYDSYVKLCLINDNVDEAKQTIQQIKSKFQLKLNNLDVNLINKFDKPFIDEFIKN